MAGWAQRKEAGVVGWREACIGTVFPMLETMAAAGRKTIGKRLAEQWALRATEVQEYRGRWRRNHQAARHPRLLLVARTILGRGGALRACARYGGRGRMCEGGRCRNKGAEDRNPLLARNAPGAYWAALTGWPEQKVGGTLRLNGGGARAVSKGLLWRVNSAWKRGSRWDNPDCWEYISAGAASDKWEGQGGPFVGWFRFQVAVPVFPTRRGRTGGAVRPQPKPRPRLTRLLEARRQAYARAIYRGKRVEAPKAAFHRLVAGVDAIDPLWAHAGPPAIHKTGRSREVLRYCAPSPLIPAERPSVGTGAITGAAGKNC